MAQFALIEMRGAGRVAFGGFFEDGGTLAIVKTADADEAAAGSPRPDSGSPTPSPRGPWLTCSDRRSTLRSRHHGRGSSTAIQAAGAASGRTRSPGPSASIASPSLDP